MDILFELPEKAHCGGKRTPGSIGITTRKIATRVWPQ